MAFLGGKPRISLKRMSRSRREIGDNSHFLDIRDAINTKN